MSTTHRLLRFLRPFRGRVALAVLLGFATIASGIALLMTSAWLIAAAALQPSIAELQVAIVGVRAFGISRGVFRYLERVVSHEVNFKLLAELRTWFYDKLEPLAPARLQQVRSGDLLARIVADVETLENFYVRVAGPPLVALLVLALMWLLLGQFSLLLPALLSGFLLLAGLGLPLLTRRLGREPGRELVAVRSQLNAGLVDGIQGLADLLAFGADRDYAAQVAGLGDETAFWQRRMARIGAFQAAGMGLLTTLAAAAGLAVAIPLVEQGLLDGVNLAVIALGIMASFEAVAPLPPAGQYLEQSLAAARRLFEITGENYELRITNYEFTQPRSGAERRIRSSHLSVEGLRFRYAPGEPRALDGVSFELPPGRTIAVVGASGAGKSTLISLLLRFREAEAGEIWLDGRPSSQIDPETARRFFSVVAQDTHLFNATIGENLRLARPGAGDEEMVEAARQAQIHDFIEALPAGYETWIGEQGLRLSGGQRQRLAIARAILKDAPILILDEPTANLDPLTGQAVMATLREAAAGRSTLLITHDLAGLEQTGADEILVLAAGRIVEQGAHRELLQLGGHYRRLWELQRGRLAG